MYGAADLRVLVLLMLSANDRLEGRELSTSDGATWGTVLVEVIHAARRRGSSPFCLTDVDGTVYFSAWGRHPRPSALASTQNRRPDRSQGSGLSGIS